jgi:hypothetical protein
MNLVSIFLKIQILQQKYKVRTPGPGASGIMLS